MEGPGAAGGLAPALRALAATLLEAIGTRAELAVVELREETERRKAMLVMALAAAFFLSLALVFAGAFVVVAFWDTHRLAAAGGVALAYFVLGLAAGLRVRAMLRASPPPFDETLRTLAADRELLRPDT